MVKVTLHKNRSEIIQLVEQGDIIISKGSHLLICQVEPGRLKAITLAYDGTSNDIGNRLNEASFGHRTPLAQVIELLGLSDVKLIKKNNYDLTLEYQQ